MKTLYLRLMLLAAMLVGLVLLPQTNIRPAVHAYACNPSEQRFCENNGGLWFVVCCQCSYEHDVLNCEQWGGVWNYCTGQCEFGQK